MKPTPVKILALFLCACLLLFTALSLGLGIVHAGHSCHQESCEICTCLQRCDSLLNLLNLLLCGSLAGLLVALLRPFRAAGALLAAHFTPVSLRVRMNQ